jgi:hypothetical protein
VQADVIHYVVVSQDDAGRQVARRAVLPGAHIESPAMYGSIAVVAKETNEV